MPNVPSETERTYLFRNNVSVAGADAEDTRALSVLAVKQGITGGGNGWTIAGGSSATPSSPWRVLASSNGISAQLEDLWLTTADIVWSTSAGPRSWTLLHHPDLLGPGIAGEILIVCSQAGAATRNATLAVSCSRDGFSTVGMSPSSPPTAADAVVILPEDGTMANAGWQGADTDDATHASGWAQFHIASDGTAFRMMFCRGGVNVATWDFFVVSDWLSTGWSHPFAFMINSIDAVSDCNTWSRLQQHDPAGWISLDTTVGPGPFFIAAANTTAGAGAGRADETSACPLGGENTSGMHLVEQRGPLPVTDSLIGYFRDMWIGRAALAGGDYPNDGSNRFGQYGILIFPHDGSAVNMS